MVFGQFSASLDFFKPTSIDIFIKKLQVFPGKGMSVGKRFLFVPPKFVPANQISLVFSFRQIIFPHKNLTRWLSRWLSISPYDFATGDIGV